MESVDNNQFEIKPSNSKRKMAIPCSNVYLNPALDILANEDRICNTAMEIVPLKKRKRTRSCDIAAFENSALDLGISKSAVNEFLMRELENVRKNLRPDTFVELKCTEQSLEKTEPIYANLTDLNTPSLEYQSREKAVDVSELFEDPEMDSGISVMEQKSLNTCNANSFGNDVDMSVINSTNIQTNITNQIIVNNSHNLSFSFIERLALDSPNLSNRSLCFDDDLNESNIMEIKTITVITKKKQIQCNTNPFLAPDFEVKASKQNPFLFEDTKPELEYNEEVLNRPALYQVSDSVELQPRRLFCGDTNSTISTVNESLLNLESHHEYENVDNYRSESPIYENTDEIDANYNKQSKILGHDVSQFSTGDIMNINKSNKANSSNDSSDSKKFKHQLLKASNKLSRKVLKSLKKTFKGDKVDNNVTLNPYEVPRKLPKQKLNKKDSGIENPALNLDNSDEIEIEEMNNDEEHHYETVKTIRNTQLNMNVTPLRERVIDNIDISHNKSNTPSKKVRFDSTLNQEKVITGNSFDYGVQSPGFDAKIEKYHDELENCINERKFLQQNM